LVAKQTFQVVVVFAAAFHLFPASAKTQTVQGQLLDPGSGTPIQGALVLLLGETGAEEDGYLSNAQGRFILEAKDVGVYTVRVERIGYRTTVSEPFEIGLDEVSHLQLEVLPAPVALSELSVEGEQVCRLRPEEGLAVSRVWEEVRKALSAQLWTDRQRLHRFTVAYFQNELERDLDTISAERTVQEGLFDQVPFLSLPVEELHENGYIQQPNRLTIEYYAPDAGVLLSDPFLDTHCFRLVEDRREEGLLGLGFEPVERRREVDIQGVIWVDERSSELRVLDFRYTPNANRRRELSGGTVEFDQLPSGAWLVRRWSILMPSRRGYKETGAEILSIEGREGSGR
jgi:hypothetical protein